MQIPAEIACFCAFAVTPTKQPETRTSLNLDPEIVAYRLSLACTAPPFPNDPFRTIGADDDMRASAPGKPPRWLIGQFGNNMLKSFGAMQQTRRTRARRMPGMIAHSLVELTDIIFFSCSLAITGRVERMTMRNAAFGNIAFNRHRPPDPHRTIGEQIDQGAQIRR